MCNKSRMTHKGEKARDKKKRRFSVIAFTSSLKDTGSSQNSRKEIPTYYPEVNSEAVELPTVPMHPPIVG